jgi:hypothetical protein
MPEKQPVKRDFHGGRAGRYDQRGGEHHKCKKPEDDPVGSSSGLLL